MIGKDAKKVGLYKGRLQRAAVEKQSVKQHYTVANEIVSKCNT